MKAIPPRMIFFVAVLAVSGTLGYFAVQKVGDLRKPAAALLEGEVVSTVRPQPTPKPPAHSFDNVRDPVLRSAYELHAAVTPLTVTTSDRGVLDGLLAEAEKASKDGNFTRVQNVVALLTRHKNNVGMTCEVRIRRQDDGTIPVTVRSDGKSIVMGECLGSTGQKLDLRLNLSVPVDAATLADLSRQPAGKTVLAGRKKAGMLHVEWIVPSLDR